MKKFKTLLISSMLVVGVVGGSIALPSPTVSAKSAAEEIGDGAKTTGQESKNTLGDNFKTVTNILLFLIGAISVIMLIIGGFRYVVSAGDSGATKGAKDTILYAVIGIIVAVLA